MSKAHELLKHGQSVWYDNIQRALLEDGSLATLVESGIMGVTSNPAIFEKAFASSADYDRDMRHLMSKGHSDSQVYEALAVRDIQQAADILHPTYEQTNGVDGYISLEVSPELANDTTGTVADARRLFKLVGRPNVMIKVPATAAGIPAIETLIGDGININVTLIFSLSRYAEVMEAYVRGLEKLASAGGDLSHVASVASFFVSRVDTAVDALLEARSQADLQGKIAVANAKLAYQQFKETFAGERWAALAGKGARVQRPLWASTGTKNPAYPDTLYVDALIGPDTVNTVPPATLDAFMDHGMVAETLTTNLAEAQAQVAALPAAGIDLDTVTEKLLEEGVQAFAKAFVGLMSSIAGKRALFAKQQQVISASLGQYQAAVTAGLKRADDEGIAARIWLKDNTVWRLDPSDISNRLGWLDCPTDMPDRLPEINQIADEIWNEGISKALVLGMGGSSLAPEVFAKTFGLSTLHLELGILDSTDPDHVRAIGEKFPPEKTIYLVATKSGGTVETFSFFRYFYNLTVERLGAERAGKHFLAITDPGSGLADVAQQYNFRHTFLNDPNIGGRYAALSLFGLVPAALDGVNVPGLLTNAAIMAERCGSAVPAADNIGIHLGVILGALANAGRDKVTFFISPALESFGDWVEQLIAESTGKESKGILPVVHEPVGKPDIYGADRLFIHLKLGSDSKHDTAIAALEAAGHPVVRLYMADAEDLGSQFLLWEYATAVAGWMLNIQPFDQPNVESAKVLARKVVAAYKEKGTLPSQQPSGSVAGLPYFGSATLADLLGNAKAGDYISLQAYIPPTAEADAALAALRERLWHNTKLATTVGYGPRFLHSTGQLHKGDAGNGIFIIFTSDAVHDVAIPDEAGKPASTMTFGVLKMAQALGDMEALVANQRRVVRIHLDGEPAKGLQGVLNSL
jgi:transaldolase / glucose-6-phosphate isomerase